MDLYDILGVRHGASAAEIRRAYQKRARALHPHLNPGDPAAAERFRGVSHAFEILSDPQRRAAYDRGEPAPLERSAGPEVGFEGFDFEAELRMGSIGFREIFDNPPAAGSAAAGENLEHAAQVSFDEAFSGTRRRVQVVRLDQCPICRGQGDLAVGAAPCPSCQGTGRVRARRGHMIFSRLCAECGATGVIDRKPCTRCGEEGRLMRSEWLDVEIPAGVSDGTRLRVPAAGNAGRRGGPAGDFVLAVAVAPHPFYRREGDDLHCSVPVSLTEAALGAHVAVPTPDGSLTIEMPAGTQPGQRFRLRKRGMPRLGQKGRGDLYVEARVVVPAVAEERGRALLQEFARLHKDDPRQELAALLEEKRAGGRR